MDGYIGEIRMFAGNYAPQNWAFCAGQTLSIAQNTALFSLLGTVYGGNGITTFALPDLQGMLPMGVNYDPARVSHPLGQTGGTETVTLTTDQIPSHSHTADITVQIPVNNAEGTDSLPAGNYLSNSGGGQYTGAAGTNEFLGAPLAKAQIGTAGGGQAHPNLPPYLCVNFIICVAGAWPPRPDAAAQPTGGG